MTKRKQHKPAFKAPVAAFYGYEEIWKMRKFVTMGRNNRHGGARKNGRNA